MEQLTNQRIRVGAICAVIIIINVAMTCGILIGYILAEGLDSDSAMLGLKLSEVLFCTIALASTYLVEKGDRRGWYIGTVFAVCCAITSSLTSIMEEPQYWAIVAGNVMEFCLFMLPIVRAHCGIVLRPSKSRESA